jgi:hypothetical protein
MAVNLDSLIKEFEEKENHPLKEVNNVIPEMGKTLHIDEAALRTEANSPLSIPIPEIEEDEVIVGQNRGNENFDLSVLLVENFKNVKDYRCISVDGLILSESELPVFYHKDLESEIQVIARLYNKSLVHRGDKALDKLMKLGFTLQHKVLIAFKKKKSQFPKLGSFEDMKSTLLTDLEKEDKYLVIPRKYLDKLPVDIVKEFMMSLTILESEIDKVRKEEKKSPFCTNKYYVVNQDEPYANLVWQRIAMGEKEKLKQQLKKQKEK